MGRVVDHPIAGDGQQDEGPAWSPCTKTARADNERIKRYV
jgi:hypothetical protein